MSCPTISPYANTIQSSNQSVFLLFPTNFLFSTLQSQSTSFLSPSSPKVVGASHILSCIVSHAFSLDKFLYLLPVSTNLMQASNKLINYTYDILCHSTHYPFPLSRRWSYKSWHCFFNLCLLQNKQVQGDAQDILHYKIFADDPCTINPWEHNCSTSHSYLWKYKWRSTKHILTAKNQEKCVFSKFWQEENYILHFNRVI